MRDNRVIHARYKDMQIVRYDRAGKWYLEPTIPGLPRQHVTVAKAAAAAFWGRENAGGEVFIGRYGGAAFDRAFAVVAGRHGDTA